MSELMIVLASNSPRRKELLGLAEQPFIVDSADVDESHISGESPMDYVRRLAIAKASKVAQRHDDRSLVLGSDTTVVLDGKIIGKPIDEADARRILTALRGKYHQVYTGIAAVNNATGTVFSRVVRSDVPMRDYTDSEILAYIASGDPMDKAGAYGIQNSDVVTRPALKGCFASVMGFPICAVNALLVASGVPIKNGIQDRCQELIDFECAVYPEHLTL